MSSSGSPIDLSGSSQPHKRAKMVAAACDVCRKQKRKCDGNNPCARCLNLGKQCVFSPQKQRGAKPKIKKEQDGKTSGECNPGDKACQSHFASVALLEECLKEYEEHMQPLYYGIQLDSLKIADAQNSPEKQLLLLAILANGAVLMENVKLGRCLAHEVESMLAEKFSRSTSLLICQALTLLSAFYCQVGELDKSHVLDFSVYRITRKIAKTKIEEEDQSRLLTFLQVRSLSKLVCLSSDSDDTDHYFTKARKLVRCPVDTSNLIFTWCRHHISNGYTKSQWNADAVFSLLNEADELLGKAAKCSKVDFIWIMQMFQAMFLGLRASSFYLIGEHQKALEYAELTVDCIRQQITRKQYGYAAALCFAFKVWIDLNQTDKIKENYSLFLKHTRLYRLEHDNEDISVVIDYMTQKTNPNRPVPSSLKWLNLNIYQAESSTESGLLKSFPENISSGATSLDSLLDTDHEFSVEDFLSLASYTQEADVPSFVPLDSRITDELFNNTTNMFPFEPPAFESTFPPLKQESYNGNPILEEFDILELGPPSMEHEMLPF